MILWMGSIPIAMIHCALHILFSLSQLIRAYCIYNQGCLLTFAANTTLRLLNLVTPLYLVMDSTLPHVFKTIEHMSSSSLTPKLFHIKQRDMHERI